MRGGERRGRREEGGRRRGGGGLGERGENEDTNTDYRPPDDTQERVETTLTQTPARSANSHNT